MHVFLLFGVVDEWFIDSKNVTQLQEMHICYFEYCEQSLCEYYSQGLFDRIYPSLGVVKSTASCTFIPCFGYSTSPDIDTS